MRYEQTIDILKSQRHYFTHRAHLEIEEKSRANYVTNIDKTIENNIKQALLTIYPHINFVGEEEVENLTYDHYWLLDPIDGTQNYIKGQYPSMISLALVEKGTVVYAVIYDPYFDVMYTAYKGEGAFQNGSPIHVSADKMNKAIVMVGTAPYTRDLTDDTFKVAKSVYEHASDIRRSGSACYDLVQVATGRAEAYFEHFVHSWDYAAGLLIVQEAGGIVSDMEGKSLNEMKVRTTSILASNHNIHQELIQLIEANV